MTVALIPIGQLPAEVEKLTGQRIHRSTCERWRMRGVRGVKLQTILVGGRRYVDRDAFDSFIQATTSAADDGQATTHTPRSRRRSLAQANRELDSAGI